MAGRQAGKHARRQQTPCCTVRPRVRHNSVLRIRCLPLAPLAQLSISYLQRLHGQFKVSQCKSCNMIEQWADDEIEADYILP